MALRSAAPIAVMISDEISETLANAYEIREADTLLVPTFYNGFYHFGRDKLMNRESLRGTGNSPAAINSHDH